MVFLKKNKIVCYTAIILNIISLYLTAFGLLEHLVTVLHITNYLNPLNWMGYFALGYLLQDVDCDKIFVFLVKTRIIAFCLFIITFTAIVIGDIKTGYFKNNCPSFNKEGQAVYGREFETPLSVY